MKKVQQDADSRLGYTDEELLRLPNLLTVREAARALRVSISKMRTMCQFETIPAIKVGRQYRIKREVVFDLLGITFEDLLERRSMARAIPSRVKRQQEMLLDHEEVVSGDQEDVLLGASSAPGNGPQIGIPQAGGDPMLAAQTLLALLQMIPQAGAQTTQPQSDTWVQPRGDVSFWAGTSPRDDHR